MIRIGTSGWSEKLAGWAQDGQALYCFLRNDYHGYALDNAAQLKDLAGEKG